MTDKTFRIMNHFRISTSTLNTSTNQTPNIKFRGFGPVVEDGYGLSYGVFDEFTIVVATAKPAYGVNPFHFTSTLDNV